VSVAESPLQLSQLLARAGLREVKVSYITNRSDVDYALFLPEGKETSSVVNQILKLGSKSGWKHEQATVVPRFAVSQWTLVSEDGAHLDLTIFTDQVQFTRFRERQSAFREVFWHTRQYMHATYSYVGILAFDAYIYVLKAFAAYVSRSAFTSFQAVCLGLFVLQHSRSQKTALIPSAPFLFNHFLCFCISFFGKGHGRKGMKKGQQTHSSAAIDLSRGGRMMRRVGARSRAELYFVAAEERNGVASHDWQNVLHNADPAAISEAAESALEEWFGARGSWSDWGRLSRELTPSIRPNPR